MKLFFLGENSVICVNKILGATRIGKKICITFSGEKENLVYEYDNEEYANNRFHDLIQYMSEAKSI